MEREPTKDEAAGMAWWNGLNESERAYWLRETGTAVVADAWAEWKRRKGFRELPAISGEQFMDLVGQTTPEQATEILEAVMGDAFALLDNMLAALQSRGEIPGSTSETCAVALAADRDDLLPAPYTTLAEAWNRLNERQRAWVGVRNPSMAARAADAAGDGCSVARH